MPAGATSSSPSDLPRASSSRRAQGRRRLRQRRRLPRRARCIVGAGRRGRADRGHPDGININDHCGSTHPQLLQETVVASGADIGLALDGDADRLIVVDEKGELVDGDQLMALIALELNKRGELDGGAVVATVMSNLGLERKLEGAGLELMRTRSATAMCSKRCGGAAAMSAASNRVTSSCPTTPLPATGWSRGFRCWRRSSRPKFRPARCCASSNRCRSCSRTSASTAARAARGRQCQQAHRRRRSRARRARPPGHPQVGHRAPHPRHGRGRRSGRGRTAGR